MTTPKRFLSPDLVFGPGTMAALPELLGQYRRGPGPVVWLIDEFFRDGRLGGRLPVAPGDVREWVAVAEEPNTGAVDRLMGRLRAAAPSPSLVVGIGGGIALDVAKCVSILYGNPGGAADYQGWDLVRRPGLPKIGIPTLSGTGAEVSRTAVLISPVQKLGINSLHSLYDLVVMDPELTATVPPDQRFYTAMDCFIHSVESLSGTMSNGFSRAYSEKAIALCRDVFAPGGHPAAAEKLMMASYFGGCAIIYSETGICHALSYGLSFVLGIHHGIGNCLVFNVLDDHYGDYVREFRDWAARERVALADERLARVTADQLGKMVAMTRRMVKPLTNALGPDWEQRLPETAIAGLYRRMGVPG